MKLGVGEQSVAVVIRDLLRLHQQVDELRPEGIQLANLAGLDEVEHLQHRKSLGRRRRLEDLDVPVGSAEGLAPARLLRVKVRLVEKSASRTREARERARRVARVKALVPVRGDAF